MTIRTTLSLAVLACAPLTRIVNVNAQTLPVPGSVPTTAMSSGYALAPPGETLEGAATLFNGSNLATCYYTLDDYGEIQRWDGTNAAPSQTIQTGWGGATAIAFGPGGLNEVYITCDMTLVKGRIDGSTYTPLSFTTLYYSPHHIYANDVSMSPDGRNAILSTDNGTYALNLENGAFSVTALGNNTVFSMFNVDPAKYSSPWGISGSFICANITSDGSNYQGTGKQPINDVRGTTTGIALFQSQDGARCIAVVQDWGIQFYRSGFEALLNGARGFDAPTPPAPPALEVIAVPPSTGQFVFQLQGQAGVPYIIQSSTDLFSWASISTNWLISSTLNLTNFLDSSISRQFFRAVWQP